MANEKEPRVVIRTQDIMKFGPKKGKDAVEEARQAMLAAGEAPGSVKVKAANDARRAAFNQAIASGATVIEARTIAAQAASDAVAGIAVEPAAPLNAARTVQVRTAADQRAGITQPTVVLASADGRAERLETVKFIAEIKQVGGQWVCELTYKNGAGTERFVAATKSQLMLKLAEGKGNATLKIRSNAQVARLTAYQYDHAYEFPDLTQEEYDGMPEKVKDQLIDAVAAKAVIRFKEDTPAFLPSALNSQKLREFLDERKAVITLKNLEMAFATLTAMESLEVRNDFEPTVVDDSTVVEDSTTVAPTAPAVSTAAPVVVETQLRKRGTTGLMPGFSSAGGDTTLDSAEEAITPREPSRAELLALPLEEHRKLFKASLKQPNRSY